MGEKVKNLYVHFPFCRSKCTYCALYSRAGISIAERDSYVQHLASAISTLPHGDSPPLATIYFGGGSPALCSLQPIFKALRPLIAEKTEFSIELHPLDVTTDTLKMLKDGGINRISMGVQSLNDDVLAKMRRGYTFHEAERAFSLIKQYFDNAGIDLIIGYPGDFTQLSPRHARLAKWGLKHCSAYSLILEEKSALWGQSPELDDDLTLNNVSLVADFLNEIGLKRYEISNYAVPGYECKHNIATWQGEDYYGLGYGAHGRIGRFRTQSWWGNFSQSPTGDCPPQPCSLGDCPQWGTVPKWALECEIEQVSADFDFKERKIFSLRTAAGLNTGDSPQWRPILDKFVEQGLLEKESLVYKLTRRGYEVCDSILAELI